MKNKFCPYISYPLSWTWSIQIMTNFILIALRKTNLYVTEKKLPCKIYEKIAVENEEFRRLRCMWKIGKSRKMTIDAKFGILLDSK